MAPSEVYKTGIVGYLIRADGCIEIISTGWFDTTPTSIKDYAYEIQVHAAPIKVKEFIYNPNLERYFIGPITRQLATRSRPTVVRKRASRHDKLINKRKTWLKQLQS